MKKGSNIEKDVIRRGVKNQLSKNRADITYGNLA